MFFSEEPGIRISSPLTIILEPLVSAAIIAPVVSKKKLTKKKENKTNEIAPVVGFFLIIFSPNKIKEIWNSCRNYAKPKPFIPSKTLI